MPFVLVLVAAAEILLTRPQADAMSARELEARLLAVLDGAATDRDCASVGQFAHLPTN